jgi:hypothetical protein
MNDELPTLYVCHGDDKSPRMHPCGLLSGRGSEFTP